MTETYTVRFTNVLGDPCERTYRNMDDAEAFMEYAWLATGRTARLFLEDGTVYAELEA